MIPVERLAPALVAVTGDDRWSSPKVELISGGKSNLTFLLRCAAGDLILRRPPAGELLPSAHDMAREARVQSALADTDVPVARVVLTDDGPLIGIPCYVMERAAGHVIRDALPDGYAETSPDRQALAFALADTLTALHAVDPDAIGLSDYGRPAGFLERQLRRWTAQWEASRTAEVPEVDALGRRLAARIPRPQRSALLHGDYRIDNCVFAPTDAGRITAVLDWELSTLGDPLADLGQLLLFWREDGEPPVSSVTPDVTHLPGFPSRKDMTARYADRSGLDLDELDFYVAFAHFKFAVVIQGVSARSRAGAMGGQNFGDLDDEVRALARAGLDLT